MHQGHGNLTHHSLTRDGFLVPAPNTSNTVQPYPFSFFASKVFDRYLKCLPPAPWHHHHQALPAQPPCWPNQASDQHPHTYQCRSWPALHRHSRPRRRSADRRGRGLLLLLPSRRLPFTFHHCPPCSTSNRTVALVSIDSRFVTKRMSV